MLYESVFILSGQISPKSAEKNLIPLQKKLTSLEEKY